MAGFDIEFPNDFLGGVLETDPQELCSEMLSEAAPLYVDSMKRSLRGVVDHEGDSEMVDSVKATKPKKTKTDAYIVNVGPSGYSKRRNRKTDNTKISGFQCCKSHLERVRNPRKRTCKTFSDKSEE